MKKGKKKSRPWTAEDRKRYPGPYDCQGCGARGYRTIVNGVRLCPRCERRYGPLLYREAGEWA